MSTNVSSKAVCVALAVAVAMVAFVPAAEANPVSYDFTVNVTSGPLSGTVERGSFSYDSRSITRGTANLSAGLLTSLNFTFNGIQYTAGSANTGLLAFYANGGLSDFLIGNRCGEGYCQVGSNSDQWYAAPGDPDQFIYSTATFDGIGYGDVTFAPAAVRVPEPGILGLFGFGSLLLCAAVWSRSRFG